jgi:phosphatidylserine decarboxylase
MRIPLAKYGLRELLVVAALFAGAAVAAIAAFDQPVGGLLAAVACAGFVFAVSFFRDPERAVPADAALVVSPADGTVADIVQVSSHPFMGGPAHRIGIFLSVFNVHVNRVPVTGRVTHLAYKQGGFLDARDPAASEENEAQELGLSVQDAEGRVFPVLVRQIAGLIARRIVCEAKPDVRYVRGERYGMIKFGSRTEIFLPVDRVESLDVKVGDTVRGGLDSVARLKTPIPDSPGSSEAESGVAP